MKRVLFVATVVQKHIKVFHLPYAETWGRFLAVAVKDIICALVRRFDLTNCPKAAILKISYYKEAKELS